MQKSVLQSLLYSFKDYYYFFPHFIIIIPGRESNLLGLSKDEEEERAMRAEWIW